MYLELGGIINKNSGILFVDQSPSSSLLTGGCFGHKAGQLAERGGERVRESFSLRQAPDKATDEREKMPIPCEFPPLPWISRISKLQG